MKSLHLYILLFLVACGCPGFPLARVAAQGSVSSHRSRHHRSGSRRKHAVDRKGRRGGGDRAPAAAEAPFLVHPGVLGEPVGARMIGMANLNGSKAGLSDFQESLPEGGLYHIIVRVDRADAEEALAGQLNLAARAGMRTFLTLLGTPADLASVPGKDVSVGGLPLFARSAPVDSGLWAERAAGIVRAAVEGTGVLPDYLEIWNEPGRVQFWIGSREEFLDLFQAAALRLEEEFGPEGAKVGGPGQAGAGFRSDGGQESILLSLPSMAAESGMPLDFLSWHHYIFAGGLRYHQTLSRLRERLQESGLGGVELMVSEWNVTPTTGGARGAQADGPSAAAQYAGFVASAADLGLDGQMFFMLQDVVDPLEIEDFQGMGLGALTQHGVEKPVYHVMETMNLMARETPVTVDYPPDEWEASVWGTRSGNRVRLVIGSAPLDADWVWLHASQERGADAAVLAAAVHATGYRVDGDLPSIKKLMRKGLTEEEAGIALEVLDLSLQAREKNRNPRTLRIRIDAPVLPELGSVWRFDLEHNNPAGNREALLPVLLEVDGDARAKAADDLADFLADQGLEAPPDLENLTQKAFRRWVVENAVDPDLAHQGWDLFRANLESAQTAQIERVNDLPETALHAETAAEVGIQFDQDTLTVPIQPDSVLVLDFFL